MNRIRHSDEEKREIIEGRWSEKVSEMAEKSAWEKAEERR
jgi:hypothetical protein